MSSSAKTRLSVLDLVPILEGGTADDAFKRALDLARHAERWGYHRYWVAEHHNIPGVASSATSLVIGYVAGGTSQIRVGSGGIMLPNHAPLVIAEQFGTLESLYPGRVDLGLGRAPGGDPLTARALRRNLGSSADTFPEDVRELQRYFARPGPEQAVRAVPGQGLRLPLYLLGSSTFSAELAAELGLPFAFASHFAPDVLHEALKIYRRRFRPSDVLEKPYVMICVNVFAADDLTEAIRLKTSLQQIFLNLIRGHPRPLAAPIDSMDGVWSDAERAHVERMSRYSLIGDAMMIRKQLGGFVEETGADEVIATAQIYDHAARLHSFEILAEVMRAS